MTKADDSSVGSEAEEISAESQKSDCTEEKVEIFQPVGRHMAGVMAEETLEEMAEVKDWEMVCTTDIVGSAEHTPGHQRPDPTERKTRRSVNGEHTPL